MSDEISKEHVGKYVCYQQADGGACWGKVTNQGFVNTMNGEREVLILSERYVRYERNKNLNKFRVFFPDVENDPSNRKSGELDKDGKFDDNQENLFFEVRPDST